MSKSNNHTFNKVDSIRFLLNEMYKPIDREVLWDYMRLPKEVTGLPYEIFVDSNHEYRTNRHELWLYVEDGEQLIPITVSEHPVVKTIVKNFDLNIEPVRSFIKANYKRLQSLADGRTITELFFKNIKPYKTVNEGKVRYCLEEMSIVSARVTGLPTSIWVDEDNLSHAHAPRIKFRADFQNKNSRNDPSMEITGDCAIHNLDNKRNNLSNSEIEQIRAFVIANRELLLKLDRREIDYATFLEQMVTVDENGSPIKSVSYVYGKPINGFRIVEYNGKFNYLDENDELLFPEEWLDKAGEFNDYGEGRLLAFVEKDGRQYLIDTEGKEINPNKL